jgi:glutathione S-transferase
MDSEIVVYGFETSNNMKVRVALGYKGISYRFRSIDPKDRNEVLRISGQNLTPVMVHGDRVVFDSSAILRYLDLTFPDTPRLFGGTVVEQWEIEDWELFSRAVLAGPVMEVIHQRVSVGAVDEATMARCAAAFGEAVSKLAGRLKGRRWLVEDSMSAADINAAAVMVRVRNSEIFEVPAVAESFAGWEGEVMRFDAGPGGG